MANLKHLDTAQGAVSRAAAAAQKAAAERTEEPQSVRTDPMVAAEVARQVSNQSEGLCKMMKQQQAEQNLRVT